MLYVSESACPGHFRLVTQKNKNKKKNKKNQQQQKTKPNRALLLKYSNHFFYPLPTPKPVFSHNGLDFQIILLTFCHIPLSPQCFLFKD